MEALNGAEIEFAQGKTHRLNDVLRYVGPRKG